MNMNLMNGPEISKAGLAGYRLPSYLFDFYCASGTRILFIKRGIDLDQVYRITSAVEGSVDQDSDPVSICIVSAGFDPNFRYWDKEKQESTKTE